MPLHASLLMPAKEPVEFDPLHKWLGIPPSDQPPDHYRLLGIARFESDPDVISAAADRQMAHVKGFATGPYATHSQSCLNQLSRARVCLLNESKKAVYDQTLRQQELSTPPPAPVMTASPVGLSLPSERQVPTAASPTSTAASTGDEWAVSQPVPKSVRWRRKQRGPSPLHVALVTFVIAGTLIAGLLLYSHYGGSAKSNGSPSENGSPSAGSR